MREMFVLRRADGNLFTEETSGKLRIPLWSSEEALARYKERNPELMTFLPTRLTRSLIHRIENGLAGKGTTGFFLLAEDDPAADLEEGEPIPLEDTFPGGDRPPQPSPVPL